MKRGTRQCSADDRPRRRRNSALRQNGALRHLHTLSITPRYHRGAGLLLHAEGRFTQAGIVLQQRRITSSES